MPRANRHRVAGQVWHLTERCHRKQLLLKFARDRRAWVGWLGREERWYFEHSSRHERTLRTIVPSFLTLCVLLWNALTYNILRWIALAPGVLVPTVAR